MTNEEMVSAYLGGDKEIITELYLQNTGFVQSIATAVAKSYHCFNLQMMEELTSQGKVAFFEVLNKHEYTPEKGMLTTYLYQHIKGSMMRFLESSLGCLSISKQEMANIRRVQRLYSTCENGRYPTQNELAEKAGLTKAQLSKYLGYNTHFLSVYDLDNTNEDGAWEDIYCLLADEHAADPALTVYYNICIELLEELFNTLPHKEKLLIGHSFGVFGYRKLSVAELRMKFVLSEDGVMKARAQAIRKLRENYAGSKLQQWRQIYFAVKRAAALGPVSPTPLTAFEALDGELICELITLPPVYKLHFFMVRGCDDICMEIVEHDGKVVKGQRYCLLSEISKDDKTMLSLLLLNSKGK